MAVRTVSTMLRWGGGLIVLTLGLITSGFYLLGTQPAQAAPGPHETSISMSQDLAIGTKSPLRCAVASVKSPTESVPVVASVEVTLTDGAERKQVVASGKTDAQGRATLDLAVPTWPAGQYTVQIVTRSAQNEETITRKVTLRDGARVLLVSDKPLYQPGQTIHLRALSLNSMTLAPAAGQELTFEVEDARGNKVGKKTLKTSEHGIAAYSFNLASEVNQGDYQLRAILGQTTASKTVAVKPYVLPKFKSQLTADKTFYLPKETLKGSLQVDYFFGKPIANGEVEIKASTFDVAFKDFQTFKGKTDANGKVAFEIALPAYFVGQPLDGGNALIKLEARVTDTAAHTETITKTFPVANQPIRLHLIPEGGRLTPAVETRVFVAASYPDGSPARTEVTIFKPQRQQPQFDNKERAPRAKDFGFKDGPPEKQAPAPERGEKLTTVKTGATGLGEFRFTPRKEDATHGGYRPFKVEKVGGNVVEVFGPSQFIAFLAEARDEKGNVTAIVRQLESDPRNSILLRMDKAIYQGGDRVNLDVRTSANFPTVYLDIVREGQTLLTKILEVKDGQAQHQLDLPAEMFGSLDIHAYQVLPLGDIVRDSRVIYVNPASDLKIAIAADKTVYKPGEAGKLNFAVTNSSGQPTPAALGLIIVDEAVYALQEMQPGLEKVYFTLQKELMEAKISNVTFAGERIEDLIAERQLPRDRQQVAEVLLTAVRPRFPRRIDVDPALARRIEAEVQRQLDFDRREKGGFFGDNIKEKAAFKDRAPEKGKGGPVPEPKTGTPEDPKAGGGGEPVRVREYFPETLLWYPALITDDKGKATLDVNFADSITTWRLTASASSKAGLLGGTTTGLRVFQDFFVDIDLPLNLTAMDEVSFPVAVYNYLKKPQTVKLELEPGNWFDLADGAGLTRTVNLKPDEVTSVSFRIRAHKIGTGRLTVKATGTDLSDAVRREIEVVPNGQRVEQVFTDRLKRTIQHKLTIPERAIPDANKLFVKVYPGVMSQVLEGTDALLRMPGGCFEQTSSSAYPNILVVDYLRKTKQGSPEVMMKAEQYLSAGYQRLLTFERPGGGFDWWGSGEPLVWLSAYGLHEFNDMSKVFPIDRGIIDRTQTWLMKQQDKDGTWSKIGGTHGESIERMGDAKLLLTAYVAWSLLDSGLKAPELTKSIAYIRERAEKEENPYILALAANALASWDAKDDATQAVLAKLLRKLDGKKIANDEWKAVSFPTEGQSLAYARGDSLTTETTALAVLALVKSGAFTETVNKAVVHLIKQKSSQGHWGSTQATILSLKALLAAAGNKPHEGVTPFVIKVDGKVVADGKVTGENSDVLQFFDLSPHLKGVGDTTVSLEVQGETGLLYQIVGRHHEAHPTKFEQPPIFDVRVDYDRKELSTKDVLKATAKVKNQGQATASMAMLDLGLPPGFSVDASEFEAMVAAKKINKFSVTSKQIILYLGDLKPGEEQSFAYTLKPKYPIKARTTASVAYEYYTPTNRGTANPVEITVK